MGQFGQTTEEFEYVRHNTTCHLHCTFTVIVSFTVHFESVPYRWFSRYVIAAMLVDGKQKIAH